MNRLHLSALVSLLFSFTSFAQSNEKLVQFSGVVVASDSLQPVPFASVMIKNANRGTVTDYYGFFSFVAVKGDTVEFLYLGFKKGEYIIPDSLTDKRYSLIQVLVRDTIALKETVIYPWPSKEEFRRAFLELQVPDNDLARAERNIELAQLKEIKDAVPYDGSINYKYAMQQKQSRLYTAGQYPTSNLFNPLAWAQFIKAWQDGTFKKKD
jgi:CarboxypepD_reg-like domain